MLLVVWTQLLAFNQKHNSKFKRRLFFAKEDTTYLSLSSSSSYHHAPSIIIESVSSSRRSCMHSCEWTPFHCCLQILWWWVSFCFFIAEQRNLTAADAFLRNEVPYLHSLVSWFSIHHRNVDHDNFATRVSNKNKLIVRKGWLVQLNPSKTYTIAFS